MAAYGKGISAVAEVGSVSPQQKLRAEN